MAEAPDVRAWVGFTLALVACQEAAGITKIPEDEGLVLGSPRGPRVGTPALGLDPPLLVPFVERGLALTMGSSAAPSLDLAEAKALFGGLLPAGAEPALVDVVRRQPLAFRGIHHLFATAGAPSERLRQAARLLGDDGPTAANIGSYDEALWLLCDGPCPAPEGRIPPALAQALGPVLHAAASVDRAVKDRHENGARPRRWWFEHGADALLARDDPTPPNPADPGDRTHLLLGRDALYAAAADLVAAIEAADLSPFVGAKLHFRQPTPLGEIRIEGSEDDRYLEDDTPVLLFLELGGDDVYLDRVAATKASGQSVAIHLDLAGDDRYSYDEAERQGGDRLAADDAGRGNREGVYRRASLSQKGRQASARDGVAVLFDYAGNDHYRALQASQAYADQGVALLADLAGDDDYLAESVSQGAAQSGIAILYDAAGQDHYQAAARAQGFGFIAGFGALLDDAGDDEYRCRLDGSLYPAPQDEDLSANFCQGAALGLRVEPASTALGGGIGLLQDRGGDDRYQASVFGQGVGYFGALGVLLDEAGDDILDVAWYGAGAGVHFGVGLYFDGGGDDRLGLSLTGRHLVLGAAHDFGLGLAVDLAGHDRRNLPSLSAGAASAGGLGLFVDAQGDDSYESRSLAILGAANPEGPFEEQATCALALDAGGEDRYPEREGGPREQAAWAGEILSDEGLGLAGGADGQADLGPDLTWSSP